MSEPIWTCDMCMTCDPKHCKCDARSRLEPVGAPLGEHRQKRCPKCGHRWVSSEDDGCPRCSLEPVEAVGGPKILRAKKLEPCGSAFRLEGSAFTRNCSKRPGHEDDHADRGGISWRQSTKVSTPLPQQRKDGHSALKPDGNGGFEKFDPHPALPQKGIRERFGVEALHADSGMRSPAALPQQESLVQIRIDAEGDVHVDSADSYCGYATFHGKDEVARDNARLFIAAYNAKHALGESI